MPVTRIDLGLPALVEEARGDYERDFYSWTRAQAAALRAGRWRDLDIANLAEEIEDLGNEKFSQLSSAYRVILIHMLKWEYQPARRSRSWVLSIPTQRLDAEEILEDNPGSTSRIDDALTRAYRRSRLGASDETGLALKIFPVTCPYSLEEIMTRPFPWAED